MRLSIRPVLGCVVLGLLACGCSGNAPGGGARPIPANATTDRNIKQGPIGLTPATAPGTKKKIPDGLD
jgi:hypothetical protein